MGAEEIHVRLKNEREALGLGVLEAAGRIGFRSYQTLSSIESGERELKAWELAEIAKVYGRSVDYFLKASSIEEKKPVVAWRSAAEGETRALNERRFLLFCRNYQRLDELVNKRSCSSASMSSYQFDKSAFLSRKFEYVGEVAKLVGSYYLNLGSRPACSLVCVLEEVFGVKIIYLDLGFGGSAASTIGEDFGPSVLINSSDALWRRNYDLAHELFHLLTWNLFNQEDLNTESEKSDVEKWADAFASILLLPEDELRLEFNKRIINGSISCISLIEIAREFEVSTEALLWRLVRLELLRSNQVQDALANGGIKDIDKKERVCDWETEKPRLSPRYTRLAIKALELGKISKAKFAEYTEQSIGEVTNFLKRHGYDENEDYLSEFSTT